MAGEVNKQKVNKKKRTLSLSRAKWATAVSNSCCTFANFADDWSVEESEVFLSIEVDWPWRVFATRAAFSSCMVLSNSLSLACRWLIWRACWVNAASSLSSASRSLSMALSAACVSDSSLDPSAVCCPCMVVICDSNIDFSCLQETIEKQYEWLNCQRIWVLSCAERNLL